MIKVGNNVIVLAGEYQSNVPRTILKITTVGISKYATLSGLDCSVSTDLLIAVKVESDEEDFL